MADEKVAKEQAEKEFETGAMLPELIAKLLT